MIRNDRLDDVHLKLLDQNIVAIGGEVDDDMALFIREAILRLISKGNPPIRLFISSQGGSVERGLYIYDALRSYAGEISGIVQGCAESVAAIILQACTKRLAMRHSTLLIHHISRTHISLDVVRDTVALQKVIQETENTQARLDAILVNRTKHTIKEIREACAKNESMNSEEALAFGLIDEIL